MASDAKVPDLLRDECVHSIESDYDEVIDANLCSRCIRLALAAATAE